MKELLIFESIKQKMQNSNFQKLRNGAKNTIRTRVMPRNPDFAFSIISHEIGNDFARCKHQSCLFLPHDHKHTN